MGTVKNASIGHVTLEKSGTPSIPLFPEIHSLVARNLNQFDLVSLLLTNKFYSAICKPELYRSITIDSNFSRFNEESLDSLPTTYIRTKSNIKLLFQNGAQNLNLIHHFDVATLPEEFIELQSVLQKHLTRFTMLETLRINYPLSLSLLQKVPPSVKNLAYLINVFTSRELPTTNTVLQLNSLEIGPYSPEKTALELLDLVLPSHSCTTLKYLKLVLQQHRLTLLELLNAEIGSNLPDLTSVQANLQKLSLVNMIAKPSDSSKLTNLQNQLVFLELSNVVETTPTSASFLDRFSPTQLKYLRLDLIQSVRDSVPSFLLKLPTNSLLELDLVVRYNDLKLQSLDELLDDYIRAIIWHSGSLKKLSFEIKVAKDVFEMQRQLKLSQFRSLLLAVHYPELESLRIQTYFKEILLNSKPEFFSHLPKLRNFWVIGSGSVETHWGLGNTYPGIFDDWLRVQHFPLKLLNEPPLPPKDLKLEYLKIDDKLFQIKHKKVIPKDFLDNWFEKQTRVVF